MADYTVRGSISIFVPGTEDRGVLRFYTTTPAVFVTEKVLYVTGFGADLQNINWSQVLPNDAGGPMEYRVEYTPPSGYQSVGSNERTFTVHDSDVNGQDFFVELIPPDTGTATRTLTTRYRR